MATGGGFSTGINTLYTFNRNPARSTNRNNVLECRVCEDVFGFHGDKVPRLLLCGHTLCHNCLQHLPMHNGDTILCPFDRQPTLVTDSGIWGLKKNFALLELLERLHSRPDSQAPYSTERLQEDGQLSVACDENESHVAVLYCTICGSHLCVECSERTHATRTLGQHRRIPLSEKPREKPRCATHPQHHVEFVCLEPDCRAASGSGSTGGIGNGFMCFICKDYGRHQGHQHGLLETEAEKIRSQVISSTQHMRQFMDELNETIRRLAATIQHIEGSPPTDSTGSALDARNRVRAYFHELHETLERQELAALTVVDTYIRDRLGLLRHQQEELVVLLSELAAASHHCERAVQQDDARVILAASDIVSMLESVEAHKQQFGELPEHVQLDPSIPITFTKDNRVHIGPKIEMRVVTLGLDDSGKTSILFKLKQNEFMQTIPTIGFNVETVEYKNLKFTIWDVGGQPKLRPLWKHYYLNTQAVIFVVDSSNQERLPEAHSELAKLILEKELREAALLILANKQDLPNVLSIEEIADGLNLHKLCCGRSWHIQACDAQSGLGLRDGLDWLAMQLVAAGVTAVV